MIYLLGFIVGALIVAGQVLWKTGADKLAQSSGADSLAIADVLRLLFSPYIISGVFLYGIATLVYMILLSRYEYTNLQAVVVSSSLMMTFFAALVFFKEDINPMNLAGLLLLITGVFLITKF